MAVRLKKYLSLMLSLLACLILAVIGLLWASSLMDSLFYYRSPLHAHPPEPGPALGMRLTRRVVFVLVDALREDTSMDAQVMPFLNQLRQGSAWATMRSRPPSYSQPGYSTLLIGAWPDLNDGPAANLDYEEIPTFTQDDLFTAAHRSGYKTAIAGFNWFERLVPQDAVDVSFYTPGEDQFADLEVVNAALPWLQSGEYQLILIHLDQVDYAGHHEGGPRDPRWNQAAHRADELLRQIASLLDPRLDTLLVVSDHGQIDAGGHGGDEPIVLVEPFVLAGAGVKPGHYSDINMVDVAPTLAAMMGTNLPASAQGRVLEEMLLFDQEQSSLLHQATMDQQARLLAAYSQAIGQPAQPPQGTDVAAYQRTLEAARGARLSSERYPRLAIALLLAILPLALFLWKRDRHTIWIAAAALLYALLFNLCYALLGGKTYSLSWVNSAQELINYVAMTAGLSQLIVWLVVLFLYRVYRLEPRLAASLALRVNLGIVYLIALPVLLSFVINGTLVTWTLPDFRTTFLAFLSLMQIAVVALVGSILAGISALTAWLYTRFAHRASGSSAVK